MSFARTFVVTATMAAAILSTAPVALADAGTCEPDKLAEKFPSLAGRTIRIGGDAQTAPFFFRDPSNFENIIGADADLARAVFDCHGIKYEWFIGAWSGILPAVVADQADVFFDNLYYTPERAKQVDYVLYMQAATGALTQAGNPKNIKSVDDYCGNNIAVGVGTVEEPVVRKKSEECKAAGKPEINVLTYPDPASGIRLIEDGRADIVMYDLTVTDDQVKKNPEKFSRAFMELSGFNIGTAVRNGDDELNKAIFEGLTILQANGKQAEIFTKYGIDPALQVTAEIKTD
ncbi:MAG: ABC transporter substrate-binding protein [Hyphomicrobiaceae bacterium]